MADPDHAQDILNMSKREFVAWYAQAR
jgi:hypothetical protein